MERHNTHWEDYHIIRPGETARAIYAVFTEGSGNRCEANIARTGFECPLGKNGRRNVALQLSQFNCINCVINISAEYENDFLFVNGTKRYIQEGFYESIVQLFEELAPLNVKLSLNHLNLVASEGPATMHLPIEKDGRTIIDSLAHKLGFCHLDNYKNLTIDGSVTTEEVAEMYKCIVVEPGAKAKCPGDMFGPLVDVLVTCDQAVNTPETGQVLGIVPITSYPSRGAISHKMVNAIVPLQDHAVFQKFTMSLVDRIGRPVQFATGVPSAVLHIQHF